MKGDTRSLDNGSHGFWALRGYGGLDVFLKPGAPEEDGKEEDKKDSSWAF